MKLYSVSDIEKKMQDLGMIIPDFHLVGVRSKASVPDKFDDSFYIISNHTNASYHQPYACTTNPGDYWLKNLLNPKGAALLIADKQYYNTWQIGIHKGYKALVQARTVSVYRDADKDGFAEETATIDTGMFGINIHRANEKLTSVLIGKWSAGCQVFANPNDFLTLIELCEESGKGQFTYTLLKEW